MPESRIQFVKEDVTFKLKRAAKLKLWIKRIIAEHEFDLLNLTYVFCSDEYLLAINIEHLNHDTLTDVITFNNSDNERTIEADIFISVDRVQDNARYLNVDYKEELHRVLIHGVLHLLGFTDKDPAAELEMRAKEEYCLSLRNF